MRLVTRRWRALVAAALLAALAACQSQIKSNLRGSPASSQARDEPPPADASLPPRTERRAFQTTSVVTLILPATYDGADVVVTNQTTGHSLSLTPVRLTGETVTMLDGTTRISPHAVQMTAAMEGVRELLAPGRNQLDVAQAGSVTTYEIDIADAQHAGSATMLPAAHGQTPLLQAASAGPFHGAPVLRPESGTGMLTRGLEASLVY